SRALRVGEKPKVNVAAKIVRGEGPREDLGRSGRAGNAEDRPLCPPRRWLPDGVTPDDSVVDSSHRAWEVPNLLLAQMLWTERMLAFEVLPGLQKQVKNKSLAALVDEHLGQTHQHVARAETAFRAFGAEPASGRRGPLAGAKDQHEEVASKIQ